MAPNINSKIRLKGLKKWSKEKRTGQGIGGEEGTATAHECLDLKQEVQLSQ
jgi:hypothetical protein